MEERHQQALECERQSRREERESLEASLASARAEVVASREAHERQIGALEDGIRRQFHPG